jgi:tetratricopeptide (TPR) repeat protein
VLRVSAELGSLLAAGERAAFHGRPAAGMEVLGRAVALAAERGLAAEAAAARWLLAVCASAAGQFGRALSTLDPLVALDPADPPERRVLAALGEATFASVLRQIGRHAQARTHDELALALSDAQGEAGFDALLGLAADAVGLGEAAVATESLAAAQSLALGRSDRWRQRVRLGWVRAEIALLEGRPREAVELAGAAVDLAEQSGAPRHVAKGLLFQGVAQVESGRLDAAAGTLRRGALLAESLGTLPLVWPSRAMLGALLGGRADGRGATSLDVARRAVSLIAEDLPPGLREGWLARPDVAALLET